ncbi:hypothetical protein XELAEV_18018225mg [Xenopus laevis]|uniref:Uncharacterized protein n=1 Tax=Xenopus laevis TaxID=8355 RepID=A0A974DFD4_XENLA|nr:hypothetical protein XELAEV_18018225mg [Xenopus laevis]
MCVQRKAMSAGSPLAPTLKCSSNPTTTAFTSGSVSTEAQSLGVPVRRSAPQPKSGIPAAPELLDQRPTPQLDRLFSVLGCALSCLPKEPADSPEAESPVCLPGWST